MKAVVFEGPANIQIKEMPIPRIRNDEVLVKPRYVAVCWTDIANYKGYYALPATHPNGYPAALPGIILGHEGSAEIVDIGPGVSDWKIGDRITPEPAIYCRTCAMCQRGLYEMCETVSRPKQSLGINSQHPDGTPEFHGMMTEYCRVPAHLLYKIPDNVTDLAAASVEVASIQLMRVRTAGVKVGDDVVVFGAADEHILIAQLARLAASRIVVIDPYEVRRDMAKKLGFEHVIDPQQVSIVEYVKELMPSGADVTFAGPDNLDTAIAVTRVQGSLSVGQGYDPRAGFSAEGTARNPNAPSNTTKRVSVPLPKLINLAPFYPIHGDELYRGGTPRHNYDMVMTLAAERKLDLESYYTVIPFNRLDDLIAEFPEFPEHQYKIALKVSGE